MLPKYNILFDILNIKENLIWEEIVSFLCIKETELLDIDILKEKMVYYTNKSSHGSF